MFPTLCGIPAILAATLAEPGWVVAIEQRPRRMSGKLIRK